MIKVVNAIGDVCPVPLVKTRNAIREMGGQGVVETLVDNEVAVQNLTKMAVQCGYGIRSGQMADGNYRVTLTVSEDPDPQEIMEESGQDDREPEDIARDSEDAVREPEANTSCAPDMRRKGRIVVVSADHMGQGDDELGKVLLKGFIYALGQQDILPEAIIFYNGGARITCQASASLDDLRQLEAEGVEILTCGTCLNHYGLTDSLKVGRITNMYEITEKMMKADLIVKP